MVYRRKEAVVIGSDKSELKWWVMVQPWHADLKLRIGSEIEVAAKGDD